jgi:hypothetical protein
MLVIFRIVSSIRNTLQDLNVGSRQFAFDGRRKKIGLSTLNS